MTDNGAVSVEVKEGVGKVTFFHPKKNALPANLLAELAEALLALGGNDEARVVLLQSAGDKGPFCAGASFDELLGIKTVEESKGFFMGFARLILAMRRIPKFVVVRVQGKAVGGGVGIISAADYALASGNAAIKLSEYALGFGPFVIGPAVERRIGKAAFSACAIDTEWRDAQWCLQHGLFMDVQQTLTELDNAIHRLTTRLAQESPLATAELKAVAWEGTENWESLLEERAEISGRLVLSAHAQQALQRFKAKIS
jgi:methylglutaconyl-CoA hydratase